MKKLTVIFLLLKVVVAMSQPARLANNNFDHFTVRERASAEVLKYFPGNIDHPDAGVMPFDGPPCKYCYEDIGKRDAYSRYFIKTNSNGKSFFIEQASSPINFQDERGRWREINYRLSKKSDQIFSAENQPNPVTIDINRRKLILKKSGTEFDFPELFYRDDQTEIPVGNGSTVNFTAGDDGILIKDYYPGIDLVFIVKEGRVESLFILNKKLEYGNSEIVLKQNLNNSSYKFSPQFSNEPSNQEIYVLDNSGQTDFIIDPGFAFENNIYSTPEKLNSKINTGGFEFAVSGNWLANASYPVIIDPTIRTQDSLLVVAITGTKYSPVCWTNSCDYFLSVATPPNTTITGIFHSFEFYATGACYAEDGGYSLDYAACHSPAGAPGVYTNPVHISNAFFTAFNVSVPEFSACLPAPQCASQLLNFTLHFYRCNNDTSSACAASCIRATKPWIMYIEGETVTVSSITGVQTICGGDTATIVATPQYGVAPYTYAWSSGTSVTDTLVDAPLSTTNYTVTVTDACGNTSSATTTVSVSNNVNPGFAATPNPACINEVITLNGNGAGPASDYDWIVSGSNAPGGVINDNQNPTLSYTLPGTYDAILTYGNGSCVFNDTVQITINSAAVADVTLSASPAGSVCIGDTVTFTATPVNGGASPNYEWLIDGVSVQNGASDILVSSAFVNGSLVQVIMTSNGACVSPLVDTASVFMTIGSGASPVVTISPDTAVCDGSPLTMTATFTNGGPAPFVQWFANGIPIPGANTTVYSYNVISPDTIISVEVTSSLTCVTNPVGSDTSIVNILSNLVAGIAFFSTPVGSVCSGDTVVYTAVATNGGVPTFVWYINGALSPNTGSTLSYVPNDNDSISVSMLSSLTCVVNSQVDAFVIADVSSGASPVVNLSVAPSVSICSGDTVTFTASLMNGGSAPSFVWTINGVPVGTNDSILTVSTLNDNDVVQVIATSSLTCASINTDTAAVTVTVAGNNPPTVSISALPNGVCEGDTIQFIAQPLNGGANPVYQWIVNGVPNGITTDTAYITNLALGDTVSLSMISSLSCAGGGQVVSSPYISAQLPYVTPLITLSSNPPDSICQGQQMDVTATAVNGGSTPVINWFVNGIPDTTTSNMLSSHFGGGDVIVARLISNASCLTQPEDTSNFIRVFYFPPLGLNITIDSIACPGNPITIVAHPSGGNRGPYNISWSTGETDTNSIFYSPQAWERIIATVTDNCTPQAGSDTVYVPVLTGPVANYSYTNSAPGAFQNTIQFTNLSTNADTWQWLFTDSGTTSTDWNPVHQFASAGSYEVVLYTQNNNGCIDSIVYTVMVIEDVAIYYPNTFSPNGDGLNEFFAPMGASLDFYEMTIWNRWGELIYTGDQAHPWNGRTKNSSQPAPEAVYVYRIDYADERFGDRVVTGRVTLIR